MESRKATPQRAENRIKVHELAWKAHKCVAPHGWIRRSQRLLQWDWHWDIGIRHLVARGRHLRTKGKNHLSQERA